MIGNLVFTTSAVSISASKMLCNKEENTKVLMYKYWIRERERAIIEAKQNAVVEASEHFNKHFLQNVEANTMRNPKGKKRRRNRRQTKRKISFKMAKEGSFFIHG